MINGNEISQRLLLKSKQKKEEEQQKRQIAIQEIDGRLKDNAKGCFQLTSEQKEQVYKYWHRYTDSNAEGWIEYYSGLYGEFDVRFLPDAVYYIDIDSFYNHEKAADYIDHKCYYHLLFPNIKQPEMIAKKINGFWLDEKCNNICIEDILRKCQAAGKIIVKPAIGFSGGTGIVIWDAEKDDIYSLERILRKTVIDTVVQAFLKQHKEMEKLHQSSVNTIRTISFYHKNEIYILSSVVRMGVGKSEVDNISAGGISAGIKEDGQLKDRGFNKYGTYFSKHPDGALFGECRIPCYSQICEQIKEAHKQFPYFRLISWDFAVDEKGIPVLIEANLRNGELDFHQINNGPLFHELTDEVLKEVFRKRCENVTEY